MTVPALPRSAGLLTGLVSQVCCVGCRAGALPTFFPVGALHSVFRGELMPPFAVRSGPDLPHSRALPRGHLSITCTPTRAALTVPVVYVRVFRGVLMSLRALRLVHLMVHAVLDRIMDVFAGTSPLQILYPIIRRVSILVPAHLSFGLRTDKCVKDEDMHRLTYCDSSCFEGDSEMFSDLRVLKQHAGLVLPNPLGSVNLPPHGAYLPDAADLVGFFPANNWKPFTHMVMLPEKASV